MPAVARSSLPISAILIDGVSVGDDLIFASGSINISKNITRNVTVGGVKRRVLDVSASGSFSMDGDAEAAMNTPAVNPGTTVGNQVLISCDGIVVAGVITAGYDRASETTQCQFRGQIPAFGMLEGNSVVDGTDAAVAYEV